VVAELPSEKEERGGMLNEGQAGRRERPLAIDLAAVVFHRAR
jgi:hypothetical protein